jgi:hypothetical protein
MKFAPLLRTLPPHVGNIVMSLAHPVHPCKDVIENRFVHFLKACAEEKRGRHCVEDTDEETCRTGVPGDVDFLRTFAEEATSDSPHQTNPEIMRILTNVTENVTHLQLTVHLTRDYQVLQTGNHYVNLLYCIRTNDGHSDSILFTAKFEVQGDFITHNLSRLTVSYMHDDQHLSWLELDPQSPLITSLPTKHFMDVEYMSEIDKPLGDCVLS